MTTKALRLHGRNDLRLEEFDLPPIRDDEVLARVVTDSICMSTYKMVLQGEDHKRVPKGIASRPIMAGHEFCGEILEVGSKWKATYKPQGKFTIQTALNRKDNPYAAPGFSYPFIGGTATYVVVPNEVMELGCLLPYDGDTYFHGSLSEPMSCIAGAFHASFHAGAQSYSHSMGIVEGGRMAMLGGTGPMGLGAIDYALHCDRRPGLLVVADIDESRLNRAASIYTATKAAKAGVELVYVHTAQDSAPDSLLTLTRGKGYDDVMVFAPVASVVTLADGILARDGCLNFFAGPVDSAFSAAMNFYNVHYSGTHVVGTTGGTIADMTESLRLMASRAIDPSSMITHVGGLDCAAATTMNLPRIPGGKKLIYTHKRMELTAIADFRAKGTSNHLYAALAEITDMNNGLWCWEAERYLLANAPDI